MTQAAASYWQAIGVTVKLDSTLNYFTDVTSGKYDFASSDLGGTNLALLAWGCCYAPGGAWNPDKTAVPALSALIDRLSVTDPAQAEASRPPRRWRP